MNRCPSDTIGLSRRQRRPNGKDKALFPCKLESTEELPAVFVVRQVGDSRRALVATAGIVVICHLRSTWHSIGHDNALAARTETAASHRTRRNRHCAGRALALRFGNQGSAHRALGESLQRILDALLVIFVSTRAKTHDRPTRVAEWVHADRALFLGSLIALYKRILRCRRC